MKKTHCKRGHPLDEAPVYRGRRTCRKCKNLLQSEARRDPARRDKVRSYWRAYRAKKWQDPEWREKRNEVSAIARLARTYGITGVEYRAMVEAQGGVCAICQRPPRQRRLAVDHDHLTGMVRSLLCDTCNRFVGMLEKDPVITSKAISYLEVTHAEELPPEAR